MAKKSTGAKMVGPGYLSADYDSPDIPDYVVVQLSDNAPVGVAAMGFAATPGIDAPAASLNKILDSYSLITVAPHLPPLLSATTGVLAGPAMGFGLGGDGIAPEPLGRFVQIVPKNSSDAAKIARRLNLLDAVQTAYVAPRPVPAAGVPGATSARGSAPSS